MGLISKITGHTHGSSDSTSDTAARDSTKTASGHTGHTQPGLDNRTGTSSTSSNEYDLSSAKGEHTVKHAAPLTAEHVHDQYEHVDKTQVDRINEQTEVTQTVQPVKDSHTSRTQHERVDHGTEVHEHGHSGLDREAEAELARKRENIAKEHRSTHDEATRETSARPDVDVHQRTNVVEEVVPVIEKDIVRPHVTEHHKKEVEIHNEKPTFEGTRTAAPISMDQYEQKSGVKVHDFNQGDDKTKQTFTTTQHSHEGQHKIGHKGEVQDGVYENQSSGDGANIGSSNNYSR